MWSSPARLRHFLILCGLLVAAPASGQLDSAQQKCVNALNKAGAKVNKVQNKESVWCWKRFQAGKELSASGCWLSDPRQKVAKAAQKVFDKHQKACSDITMPPFAYTSAFVVVAAGRDQSLYFLEDVYGGSPDTPASLGASLKEIGKCQGEALKRGHKLEESLLKTGNKTKKTYLKGTRQMPPVTDATSLSSLIGGVMLFDPKLDKLGAKLEQGIGKRCGALDPSALQSAFPGCNATTASGLAACVRASARCRGCWKLNEMDDLTVSCDQVDDGISNTSCTAIPPTGTPTPSPSGIPTPTGGPTPTAGPTPTSTPAPTVGPTPTPGP